MGRPRRRPRPDRPGRGLPAPHGRQRHADELDDPSSEADPGHLLDFVGGDDALFEPGQGYHYSDTNYVLLAMALDHLTGDGPAAMASEVFAPLGLQHTSQPRVGDPDPEGRVNSYWELPGSRLENVSDWQAAYDEQIIGAGNLRSTPGDSLAFVHALARGGLLGDRGQAALVDWSEPSREVDGWAYGLGVARREIELDGEVTEWIGHTGGDIGAAAIILARPDADEALAMSVNLGGFLGGPLDEHVGDEFIEELIREMR